jgi:hypothetical protein
MSKMKLINRQIIGAAFALATIVFSSGCDSESLDLFENTYIVEKLRVLAIKAEHPEVSIDNPLPAFPSSLMGFPLSATDLALFGIEARGATTKITALAVDPLHRPFMYSWLAGSGGMEDLLKELDLAMDLGSAIIPVGRETIFDLPLTNVHEEEIFEERQQVFLATIDEDFNLRTATKSIILVGGTVPNRNPVVEPIAIQNDERFFAPGSSVIATCRISDPDALDVDDELRRNWYIEWGDLETSMREETEWILPPIECGVQTIYCVARDLRGGNNWNRQDIYVGGVDNLELDHPLVGTEATYMVESDTGHMFLVGIDNLPTSEFVDGKLVDGSWFWLGGQIVPDGSQRYNFFVAPETVVATELMPAAVSATGGMLTMPTALTAEVDNIDSIASLTILFEGFASTGLNQLLPANVLEDADATEAEAAFELIGELLNYYYSTMQYIRVRALVRLNQ